MIDEMSASEKYFLRSRVQKKNNKKKNIFKTLN